MEKYTKREKIKIFKSSNSIFIFLMMYSIITAFCFKYLNREHLRLFLISTSLTPNQILVSVLLFFIPLEFLAVKIFMQDLVETYRFPILLGFVPSYLCAFTIFCINSSLSNVYIMRINFYTWQIMLYALLLSLTIFESLIIVKELIKPYLLAILNPSNTKSNERIIAENINNIILPFIAILISLMALIFR